MDYKSILERSFDNELAYHDKGMDKTEFILGMFNINLYEQGGNADFIANKFVDVIESITNNSTFEYHSESDENLQWFLAICHFECIAEKITWGSSIRGAFWEPGISICPCVIVDDSGNHMLNMEFTDDEWRDFILAVVEFFRD